MVAADDKMPPSDSMRFFLRSSLTLGSLFTGAALAHNFLKPDLVRAEPKPFFFSLAKRSHDCVALFADAA